MTYRSTLPNFARLWSALSAAWLAVRVLCAMLGFCLELMLRLLDAAFRGLSLASRWSADRVNELALRLLKN